MPADAGGTDGRNRPRPAPAEHEALDRAREALQQARSDARRRGAVPGTTARGRAAGRERAQRGARNVDPARINEVLPKFLADQGWQQRAAVGAVFGRWEQIVGQDLAVHTRPVSFDDGVLAVAADSPTWATQLRLLSGALVKRLNEELGHGTVQRVNVTWGKRDR